MTLRSLVQTGAGPLAARAVTRGGEVSPPVVRDEVERHVVRAELVLAVAAAAGQAAAGKLADPAVPVFEAQVLIRAESKAEGRAQAHLHQVLAAFDVMRGDNWRDGTRPAAQPPRARLVTLTSYRPVSACLRVDAVAELYRSPSGISARYWSVQAPRGSGPVAEDAGSLDGVARD
jgi:hypothetical protein